MFGVIVNGIVAERYDAALGAPSALAVGCNNEANRSPAIGELYVASGLGRDVVEDVT